MEKQEKRVWQSPKGPNCHLTLVTLHEIDLQHHRLAAYNEIKPNAVGQYVLLPTFVKYDQQLEAMEGYAKKYKLAEVENKMEGILPTKWEGMEADQDMEAVVSTLKAELDKAKADNEALIKKLAEAGKGK